MVEWDSDIPEYSVLEAELHKAKVIKEKVDANNPVAQQPSSVSRELSRIDLSV
jgi:hypothetical protein